MSPLPLLRSFAAPIVVRPVPPGGKPWVATHLFKGRTPNLGWIACHHSVLAPGQVPHPPHQHPEEEILVVLEGASELVIPAGPDDPSPRVEPVRAGHLVYYPRDQFHTIRNSSAEPVAYLMLKWRQEGGGPEARTGALGTAVMEAGPGEAEAGGRVTRKLEQGATEWLDRLRFHVTTLAPGAGYDAHRDAHDVAVVLLAGRVRANGTTLEGRGIMLFPGGAPHDMRNVGDTDARYLVVEFHGGARVVAPGVLGRLRGRGAEALRRLRRAAGRVRRGLARR
jgi:quercetin dioxygenase-like cupin family protein